MINKVDQQTLLVSTERFEEGIVSASKAQEQVLLSHFQYKILFLKEQFLN